MLLKIDTPNALPLCRSQRPAQNTGTGARVPGSEPVGAEAQHPHQGAGCATPAVGTNGLLDKARPGLPGRSHRDHL